MDIIKVILSAILSVAALFIITKLMGHKHLKTTEMYLHLFEMRKKDLMSGVNEYVQTIKGD